MCDNNQDDGDGTVVLNKCMLRGYFVHEDKLIKNNHVSEHDLFTT